MDEPQSSMSSDTHTTPEIFNPRERRVWQLPYSHDHPATGRIKIRRSNRTNHKLPGRALLWLKELTEFRLFNDVRLNDVESVKRLLIKRSINPNLQELYDFRLIHIAASSGYEEILKLLLSRGAVVKAKDDKGNSVLHLAVKTGKIPIVKMLLEAGCDPLEPDAAGFTSLQLVRAKLRLLNNNSGSEKISMRMEFDTVLSLLMTHLTKHEAEVDSINDICSRLTLADQTDSEEIPQRRNDDMNGLFDNIDFLTFRGESA